MDNAIAENWDCINDNGSPNAVNSNSLSNSDNNIDNIKIYPNPVKEKLFISGNSLNYSVEILSLLGQNLIKVNNTNIVDLSLLNQGIYIIKIENNGVTSTFKIYKTIIKINYKSMRVLNNIEKLFKSYIPNSFTIAVCLTLITILSCFYIYQFQ